ncbi:hypothetical protein CYCME_1754 [Cycloclasticus zancles 78-ME]|uniref:Uncharacterized protein n=1 Tax=Cycloclasticus zancles 78-ME TaxID=1198232 RepID=S5TGS2_9GAMM|nr:hypothetical protein CYCME_1754 [Cycloclasticus zancles 78-ME]
MECCTKNSRYLLTSLLLVGFIYVPYVENQYLFSMFPRLLFFYLILNSLTQQCSLAKLLIT